jgi:hypothetical protein
MLERSITRRESGTKVGQLFQWGYKVFSVWRVGGYGAKIERKAGVVAVPGIPG